MTKDYVLSIEHAALHIPHCMPHLMSCYPTSGYKQKGLEMSMILLFSLILCAPVLNTASLFLFTGVIALFIIFCVEICQGGSTPWIKIG